MYAEIHCQGSLQTGQKQTKVQTGRNEYLKGLCGFLCVLSAWMRKQDQARSFLGAAESPLLLDSPPDLGNCLSYLGHGGRRISACHCPWPAGKAWGMAGQAEVHASLPAKQRLLKINRY